MYGNGMKQDGCVYLENMNEKFTKMRTADDIAQTNADDVIKRCEALIRNGDDESIDAISMLYDIKKNTSAL